MNKFLSIYMFCDKFIRSEALYDPFLHWNGIIPCFQILISQCYNFRQKKNFCGTRCRIKMSKIVESQYNWAQWWGSQTKKLGWKMVISLSTLLKTAKRYLQRFSTNLSRAECPRIWKENDNLIRQHFGWMERNTPLLQNQHVTTLNISIWCFFSLLRRKYVALCIVGIILLNIWFLLLLT